MYLYGKNVLEEMLNRNNNNMKINKIIFSNNFNDRNLISAVEKLNFRIEYKTKNEIDKLANGLSQGIIIDVEDYKYYSLEDILEKKENPFLVMLDHLEDPHNFGAIIRTCESAGVDGIIIPNKRSVDVTPTVMKTSAGALSNMKICMVSNLNDCINKLKKRGIFIVSTDMNTTDYTDIKYDMPVCLVIGNEGKGISRLVLENSDFLVSIPMKGKVNSLNASVAAGILIYEIVKYR